MGTTINLDFFAEPTKYFQNHAALVWWGGSNKTYYAFVRPGEIVLSDSISEISCATLVGVNKDNWNTITILNSSENIHVYYKDNILSLDIMNISI